MRIPYGIVEVSPGNWHVYRHGVKISKAAHTWREDALSHMSAEVQKDVDACVRLGYLPKVRVVDSNRDEVTW